MLLDAQEKQRKTSFMKLFVVGDIFSQPCVTSCISVRLPGVRQVIRHELNALCGRPDLTGETLHRHLYESGGMDDAVSALEGLVEPGSWGLGFSAGGTALWRAASRSQAFDGLFCVSSTRLRNEGPIAAQTHVFYGELDQGKPSAKWLTTTPDQHSVFPGVGHSFYLDANSRSVMALIHAISGQIA